MNRNAIYFPYIRVPQAEWFTRVLLYWDTVSSIVPSEYVEDPSKLGKYMYGLVQEGLVKSIAPVDYIYKIPNFTEPFIEYVDNPNYPIPRGSIKSGRVNTFRIHMEKLDTIGDELSDRGLAKKLDWPWYDIEVFTANQFMAYLAATLGKLPDIESEPITDNSRSLYSFVPQYYQESKIASEIEEARFIILEEILPGPRDRINPRKLAGFKEEYNDELTNFQNSIESFLISAAAIENPLKRSKSIKEFVNRTEKDVNDLSKKMQSMGWRNITKGQIISCFVPGFLLGLNIATGSIPGMVASAFTAYKMGTQTYQDLINTDFLEGNYAAYAVLTRGFVKGPKYSMFNSRNYLSEIQRNLKKFNSPRISNSTKNNTLR